MHTGNSLHAITATPVAVKGSRNAPHNYATLCKHGLDKITDLISGVPPKVPLFCVVNHEINLIDPNKWINYQLPKCPDARKEELAEKISQYTSAGW